MLILKGDNRITVTGENFEIRSSKDIVIIGDGNLTIINSKVSIFLLVAFNCIIDILQK